MSLRYDTNTCPSGPETPETDATERRWLHVIVQTMPFVDLGGVEVEEFLWRVRYMERIGISVSATGIPVDMIRRWESTTVNVVTISRAAFTNRWKPKLLRDMDALVAQELAT